MSVDEHGWGEVERKAQRHEAQLAEWKRQEAQDMINHMLKVTTEDRLRGAIVESLSLLEQGHNSAAHNVLSDALKIGGVK